jgi:nucleotide-binding universal stress UspA family protein
MKFNRALVLVTGEETDSRAVSLAADMVRETRGKLLLLYVIRIDRSLPLDADLPEQVARAEKALQAAEAVARLTRNDVEAEMLQAREVGPAVVHEAAVRDVDGIIIGTAYPTRNGAYSLGEDIPYVLEYAACNVMLLREAIPGARPERREPAGRAGARS